MQSRFVVKITHLPNEYPDINCISDRICGFILGTRLLACLALNLTSKECENKIKTKTNCRPLRVSTLARNLLRFLLAFTILISIAATSNGMLPIQVSSHSKVLPFFCIARWAKCVLHASGIEPSPQDPKARIITARPTGQTRIRE